MKHLLPLSLVTFFVFFQTVAEAQSPRQRPNPYADIEKLETEIFEMLDRLDSFADASQKRNADLKSLQNQRDRAKTANEKTKLSLEINSLNNQARVAAEQASRINLDIRRREMEIERITRFLLFSGEAGGHGHGGKGKPPVVKAPEIRSIHLINTKQEGPVRVTGKGVGNYMTSVYEVIFTDNTKQRVEEKVFKPIRDK